MSRWASIFGFKRWFAFTHLALVLTYELRNDRFLSDENGTAADDNIVWRFSHFLQFDAHPSCKSQVALISI